MVSHRFSTVRNAGKIVVIDDGRIIEAGSHQELLKKNGKYAQMFKTQAKGYK
ncbi:MAG: ABC transporter ATP-binding/permease protein [Parcubacteria group bacterium GW2011_GWC2_39_14]|nr:MAG: ABC transporter ATP-binding/permease protein [Parcubacteria group bacterium GW2011_GWC2_39_14]KKR55071.1 MAG: ABC transporter ATP-binding/permease protein [Parcubacteria group bacterium GW2011_GWA2_40_23]